MNEHVAIKRQKSPDYEVDGYGWAMAQATLIRDGRSDEIDWENVGEEIASVGKREYRNAESALRLYLRNWLKWRLQPMFHSRHLASCIASDLLGFDDVMKENPSLEGRLPEMLAFSYHLARSEAAIETGFDLDGIPVEAPNWEDVRRPLMDRT